MGAVNKAWTRRPAWPRLFISRNSEISFLEIQKFQNSDYLRRFLLQFHDQNSSIYILREGEKGHFG